MNAFTLLPALIFSAAVCAQDIARGPMRAEYTVRATTLKSDAGKIPLQLRLRLHQPPRPRTVFQIPVWTPGSYRMRDFPEHIHEVRAVDAAGEELPLDRLNRFSWQVGGTQDTPYVDLEYRVDLQPFDRFMMVPETRRALTYEGPKVYMLVRGHTDIPCEVRFDLPEGWTSASGLVAREDGTWFAQDYDFLADCPVKIGILRRWSFESHGKPIDVVIDSVEDFDFEEEIWLGNIKAIVDAQGDIFGGFAFDRYTFLYTASPRGGGGGLEHLTSTAIGLSQAQLASNPAAGMGVTAHEFVHNWNVKRMRPIELGPFDYTRPNRTTGLWIAEGITSYYTDVTMARTGMMDEERFWQAMQRQIAGLENNPAREHVSSAAASQTVWEPKARDRNLSYYNSGEVLGLLLDIEIRAGSGNRNTLDDFMRRLFRLCMDEGRGYTESEVITVASDLAGRDLSEWFDRYVSGTQVPPYAEILAKAGVEYREDRIRQATIRGISVRGSERLLWYQDPDQPAGGRVIRSGALRSVNGQAVASAGEAQTVARELEPGTMATLGLEHPALGEFELQAPVVSVPRVNLQLVLVGQPDALARSIREGIVDGKPGRPGAETGGGGR